MAKTGLQADFQGQNSRLNDLPLETAGLVLLTYPLTRLPATLYTVRFSRFLSATTMTTTRLSSTW